MLAHPFDEVLDLEEQFYNDGFLQGQADGIKAGRIEGRTFGLEKGFEKYAEIGRLHGKSIVWANRLVRNRPQDQASQLSKEETPRASDVQDRHYLGLPTLPDNQRLQKNVRVLHALSEPASLSTENTEESVSDFDDRLKRALAKAKIIESVVGEAIEDGAGAGAGAGSGISISIR